MCPGFATRTGVFPYLNGDGSIRMELRHPEDVFDPLSMATLKSAPVTIEHPPVMVTPLNVGEYRKGHVTERVEVNRDMLDTDLIVEDQDAIDAVEKDGMRELSSGYLCDVIEESGVFEGTPYTHRQKNIKYNHLAIVKRGRAGPEVRMRLDSADAVMQEAANQTETSVDSDFEPATPAVQEMKKVIILGREVDLPSDVADTIQDYTDRFDEMRARLAQLEDRMASRKDQKDVDISQPGVSPQVKVEQQTPDGRAAGAKVPARPGTITGGKADKEEEKDDADEKKKEDAEMMEDAEDDKDKKDGDEDKDKKDADEKEDDEPAAGKGGGGSMSDVDRLKKDAEDMQKKADEAKGKYDQAAAASMNKPEKKEDKEKMDSRADVEKRIRARVKLERQAEKLVPFEIAKKFDSMSDSEIMSATIKFRHSKADLKDKSQAYLQSRFDSIVDALTEEGTSERQKTGKALLGLGGERMDASERVDADPSQARLRMISESRQLHTQKLSASKK